ncbi:MAG: HypC/HybG/HupF family hydrogenase formation chaperone [Moorellales bacterium]
MCLGIPMRVVEVRSSDVALVEALGTQRLVRTRLVESVKPGDYLMVHAGYAIQKIEPEEASESLRLWEELLANEEAGPDGV